MLMDHTNAVGKCICGTLDDHRRAESIPPSGIKTVRMFIRWSSLHSPRRVHLTGIEADADPVVLYTGKALVISLGSTTGAVFSLRFFPCPTSPAH